LLADHLRRAVAPEVAEPLEVFGVPEEQVEVVVDGAGVVLAGVVR